MLKMSEMYLKTYCFSLKTYKSVPLLELIQILFILKQQQPPYS